MPIHPISTLHYIRLDFTGMDFLGADSYPFVPIGKAHGNLVIHGWYPE